ncbi:uncharacterized protein BP5553_06388 [Venustampulla echinocandica]|uniref:Uncharacterized protein n=1 Tax=Venustampulla echinocandica TaxID=2656787 RepID=A0A370TJS7_9HELO|nr:uncharacterized protein BP5553_06388 [Venustampulla echinocandica]RDL35776.1 hypothetical protein BP5553_06388 [Venustampulla echinocandica]
MPGMKKSWWKRSKSSFTGPRAQPSPPDANSSAATAPVEGASEITPSIDAQQSAPPILDTTNHPDDKYGLKPLHTPVATDGDEDGLTNAVDIVAVHGIAGNAYNTWTHENGTLWLRDLIPKKLPGVRVFSYGYPADVFFTRQKGNLEDFSRSLLNDLRGERREKEYQNRPIIFICHSMGGIVVKNALIIAKIDDEPYENIRKFVKGIMFLATPHRGTSETQFPKLLARIANVATNMTGIAPFIVSTRPDLIEAIEKDSNILLDISTNFRNQTKNLKIASFTEQSVTPPAKSLIVDKASAIMGIHTETIFPMAGCDHTSICKFAGETSGAYKTVLNELRNWVDELNQLHADEKTSEDLECLRSLSFPELANRRQDIDKPFSHTCEWILEHESYKSWIETERELLWIKGKPGAGKSTMMAFIYQSLQEKPPSGITLEFFFHGRGTPLQKTPVGMFRSLLHQLYANVPCIRLLVRKAFKEKSAFGQTGTDWEWHRKELEDLFTNAIIRTPKSRAITIFVDALDEAGSDTANELAGYFHRLNDTLADGNRAGKICISCRHYPILAANTPLHVCVEDENHNDIARYVKQTFETELRRDKMAELLLPLEERQTLEETVTARTGGIFMWARLSIPLIIKFILEGESVEQIKGEISKVPADLGKVYEHILKNVIEPRNWSKALHLVQWVCLAERPLSVTELRYAIASDDHYIHQPSLQSCKDAIDFVENDLRMERLVTTWSGGLVEVQRHEDYTIVQSIHQTVNDFLRSDGLKYLSSLANDDLPHDRKDIGMLPTDGVLGQGHSRLCKSCVNYLGLPEVLLATPDTESILDEDRFNTTSYEEKSLSLKTALPFVLYATESWFLHAEKAENLGIVQSNLVQQFGSPPGPAFQAWINIFRALDEYSRHNPRCPKPGATMIHIASGSNLRSAVQLLLSDNESLRAQDSAGNRALHFAARWGHLELVEILLNAGADIGAKNFDGGTAFEHAAANGHEEVLELLFNCGVNVNESTGAYGNALQAAARNGNKVVVQKLLKYGAEVNIIGGLYYGTALQAACNGGHADIARLLLEKGAEVNIISSSGYGTALQAACGRGHADIAKLLLEKGAEVNIIGSNSDGTALQAACSRGHADIAKLLLEKGAEVNIIGGLYYGTALQAACNGGHADIAKLLLEKGAEVNLIGGFYNGTALQAACARGHTDIARLLLEKGAIGGAC